MIHQLRIYEIFESNKDAFHARFRDHAARIMKRYGFDIVAMWETKCLERTEFVYLLRWPDEVLMHARAMRVEAAWAAARAPGPLRAFFICIQSRRGKQVEAVATARK